MNTETMTREKFYEYAMDNIVDYLPSYIRETNFEIKFVDCSKKGSCYKGMVINKEDEPECGVVRPVVNLDQFYDFYVEHGDIEECLDAMSQVILTEAPSGMNDMREWIKSYDICKEKLFTFFFHLGFEPSDSDCIKEVAPGLIMGIRLLVDVDSSGMFSVVVNKDLIHVWGIDRDGVFKDAMKNAPKINPVKISELGDVVGLPTPDGAPNVFIVSSKSGHSGTPLFYRGVMSRVAKKIGGSYYVLPSSTKEFLCIPYRDEDELCAFRSMVRAVNEDCVDPSERLSNDVYFYDADAKEFSRKEKTV